MFTVDSSEWSECRMYASDDSAGMYPFAYSFYLYSIGYMASLLPYKSRPRVISLPLSAIAAPKPGGARRNWRNAWE